MLPLLALAASQMQQGANSNPYGWEKMGANASQMQGQMMNFSPLMQWDQSSKGPAPVALPQSTPVQAPQGGGTSPGTPPPSIPAQPVEQPGSGKGGLADMGYMIAATPVGKALTSMFASPEFKARLNGWSSMVSQ